MLRQALSASPRALRSAPLRTGPAPLLRTRAPSPLLSRPAQPAAAACRWYSEAKEASAKEASAAAEEAFAAESTPKGEGEEAGAGGDRGEADALSELKKALEAKELEARDWKDKCLRTVADFRNLQDRTQREVKTAREFAITKFARDLVESVDNLDRALTTVPAAKLDAADKTEDLQDLANLYEGLRMTETILMQTLAKHGLERIDPDGQPFDPNEHEAVFMSPMPDKANNTIGHVQQKGFKLNGRVLRAAKVGVVKNS